MQDSRELTTGAIVIHLEAEASVPARFAAKELSEQLAAVLDKPVPLGTEENAPATFTITVTDAPLQEGHGRIILDKDGVLLTGSGAGVLYAVYDWLEQLGLRWFAPDETSRPPALDWQRAEAEYVIPDFEYREVYWHHAIHDGSWSCRNRLNGNFHPLEAKHGGKQVWAPYVHSFYHILPPAQYAAEHPEYYSYRQSQGHVTSCAQLCLANPEVFEHILDHVLREMARPDVRIVEVSQNDCAAPCECAECAAIDHRSGSHSGTIIDFCNRLAAHSSRKYPDKYIGTIAYDYSQKPPANMAVHDNVIVRLCSYGSCTSHPLSDCECSRPFLRDLRQWCTIAKRVYVWHYVTNFNHFFAFHPNLDALAKDVRLYRNAGVRGIFFQGACYPGAAFAELNAYVQSRLAWDSDRDLWDEVAEFVHAYYGPAAEHVRKLIDAVHAHAREGRHFDLFSHPHEGQYTETQLAAVGKLLVEAESAAQGDTKVLRRLRKLRLWYSYSCLLSTQAVHVADRKLHVSGAKDSEFHFAEVADIMAQLDLHHYRENPKEQNFVHDLAWTKKTTTHPLFAMTNGEIEIEVAPDFGGMIVSLTYLPTGQALFRHPVPRMCRYPHIGGYTEATGGNSNCDPAVTTPFTLTRHDERVLAMSTELAGMSISRTVRLAPDGARLAISTRYQNITAETQCIAPVATIIVGFGPLAQTQFFRHDANVTTEVTVAVPLGPVDQFQWLSMRGAAVPASGWSCWNRETGIGLTERYPAGTVSTCHSNGYVSDERILLETMAGEHSLAPGEEWTFARELEVMTSIPTLQTPVANDRVRGHPAAYDSE